MADVTVIAPNVVEFVGNFARQSATVGARAQQVSPPRTEAPPKPPENAGEQSRRLAANRNTAPETQAAPKPTRSSGFYLGIGPRNRPGQQSTPFLAQRIAQESAGDARAARPFEKAIAAYQRSRAPRPSAPSEPVIITRSVDEKV